MPKGRELFDEESNRWLTIEDKGIKYLHTYTISDVRSVKLINGWTDIIALFRNPSGKNCRGPQWEGDWSRNCDLWTKATKKQVGPAHRLTSDS